MMTKTATHEIDILMGQVLRETRRSIGLTQKGLAHQSGISFQQIQKYETGTNRISISRLFSLCAIMDIVPSVLLQRVQERAADGTQLQAGSHCESLRFIESQTCRQALEQLASIKDQRVREAVMNLLTVTRKATGQHN